jgi:hypothetical protein
MFRRLGIKGKGVDARSINTRKYAFDGKEIVVEAV